MARFYVTALALVLAGTMPLAAGDTKSKKPLGNWSKSTGDFEVKFHFNAETLTCTLSGSGVLIDIEADYGMAKDGTIFGRVSKVEKKGICAGPKVGDVFTFRAQVKDKMLTISNLGPGEDADARQLIEGEYKKK